MVEPKITKTDVIVVDTIGENEYADLTWTDKAGKDYKVKQARRKYFDDIIKPNLAVELSFAEYKGHEYVYSAKLVSEKMAEKASEALQPQTKPVEKPVGKEVSNANPYTVSPQSIGLCWKEIGKLYREKKLTELLGKENAIKAVVTYRDYLLASLKLPFDGATLPTFEEKEKPIK